MMQRFLLLGCIAAVVVVAPRLALAIINGEVDDDELFPEVGAFVLVQPVPFPNEPEFLNPPAVACSGVLIHPRVMLTAGHCTAPFEEIDLDVARVSFAVDGFDSKTWIEVDAVFTHPDFNPNSRANDIGVVILSKPVKMVTPALLPSAFLLDDLDEMGLLGDELVIAGYGKNESAVHPDGLRRFGVGPIAHIDNKRVLMPFDAEAGVTSGGSHDSGSPAYGLDPETGSLIVLAILSDRQSTTRNKYVRVDQPSILAFLDAVLDAVESKE